MTFAIGKLTCLVFKEQIKMEELEKKNHKENSSCSTRDAGREGARLLEEMELS